MDSKLRPIKVRIAKETDVYLAIFETEKLTMAVGFDNAMTLKIKTAVSELGRNIIKYADRGIVTITPILNPVPGIEIHVSDAGPGIKDVEVALSDSFSTGGTLGLGLPGVKRLMDEFEIESVPNEGTQITIRKWVR